MKRFFGGVSLGVLKLITIGCVVASTAHLVAQTPDLKTLDPAFFDKSAPPEVVAMVLLFKTHPELLDNPTYMNAFVMMNNCGPNQNANRNAATQLSMAMKNEFQRPKIVEFYKDHATSILSALRIKPLEISLSGPPLKEYDAAQHAFPFNLKRDNGFPLDSVSVGGSGWFTLGCANVWMPARFEFSPIMLKNVPASEADAENYVTNVVKNQLARNFQILLKMELGRTAVNNGLIEVEGTLDTITLRGVGQVTRQISLLGAPPVSPPPTIVVLATIDPKTVAYQK